MFARCVSCRDKFKKEDLDEDGYCPECSELRCMDCGEISEYLDDEGVCDECRREAAIENWEGLRDAYD